MSFFYQCEFLHFSNLFLNRLYYKDTMAENISIIESSKDPYTRAINVLVRLRNAPFEYLSRHSNYAKIIFSFVFFVLYNAYLIGCIVKQVDKGDFF